MRSEVCGLCTVETNRELGPLCRACQGIDMSPAETCECPWDEKPRECSVCGKPAELSKAEVLDHVVEVRRKYDELFSAAVQREHVTPDAEAAE